MDKEKKPLLLIPESIKKPMVLSVAAATGCLLLALLSELVLFMLTSTSKPESQYICLTIDVSGSMYGDKLEEVKRAAKSFVAKMVESQNYLALTSFSSSGKKLVAFTQQSDLLYDKIERLSAFFGFTNFEEALKVSSETIAENGNQVKDVKDIPPSNCTLLIFTDGENSMGDPQEAIRIANSLRKQGVRIYAITTQDGDVNYLQYLTGDSSCVINTNDEKIEEAFKQAEKMISSQLMETTGSEANPTVALIRVCLWSVFLCFGIALGLVGMQNRFLEKKAITFLQAGKLLAWSILAGCIAGGCGQFLFSFASQISSGFLLSLVRIISWGILGAVMTRIMVMFIPNLSIHWAWRGGILGGICGAIGFLLFTELLKSTGTMEDIGGRLVGAFILGACIGFMVGVVEKICRSAWLTVVFSPKRFTQVNMGPTAISIGSAPNDTVHIDGCSPSAMTFKLENGVIRCSENGMTINVQPGEQLMVGNVKLVVCTPEFPYTGGPKIGGQTSGPSRPSGPSGPSGPSRPSGPSGPSGPSRPSGPSGPSSPSRPSGPSGAPRKTIKLPPKKS